MTDQLTQTLIIALQGAAEEKDRDANQMDRWAEESRRGGWSTHQVEAQLKLADKLRREAAGIRRVIAETVRRIRQQ